MTIMLKIFQRKLEVCIRKNKNRVNICVVFLHIGYKKHPSIKNKLIIDEKVADIVWKIFDMYASGHGTVEIANYLNNNNYLSPSGYRKTGIVQNYNSENKTQPSNPDLKSNISKYSCSSKKTSYNWNQVTLCNMLKNEVYIGNTIQNKKTVISYKIKKIRPVEKRNQIRVNHTHAPIIDKDVFEKVNNILEKRGTNTKFKYDYLLRGILYCYHCKRKLQIVLKKSSKRNSISYPYIICSNYKSRNCYPLNINYKKFEKHILYLVKKIVENYADKEIFYSVYEKYQNKTLDIREGFKKKIEQLDKAIFEVNSNLDNMYMDRLKGVLLEEDYVRYSPKYIIERANLIKQQEELKQKLIQTEEELSTKSKTKEEKELDKLMENFLKLEQIDKMYLYRLINKIEIDKDKNIYIYFNFSKQNFMTENLDEFIRIEEFSD